MEAGHQLVTPTEGQGHPMPADLQIALASKPGRIDPAALALFDHCCALGDQVQGRECQDKAQPL
jgi:hypothetical protein